MATFAEVVDVSAPELEEAVPVCEFAQLCVQLLCLEAMLLKHKS